MTELKLLGFQKESVTKLVEAAKARYASGLIADDMGLGKTVQGIMIDKRKREHGSANGRPLTLVVAPLSVLDVWEDHYKLWNPQANVYVINPKSRINFVRFAQQSAAGKGKYDVFICHWEALRLMPELQKIRWFHIIADEVHRAKNRKAQQTVNLKKLPTDHKLGLSGTPADDKPDDFWSVLNWLYPRVFTAYWRFFNYHCVVLYHDEPGIACGCLEKTGRGHKRPYREVVGTANIPELMKQIEPFYVRRLKEDVLRDLPDKYYTSIWVDLSPQQKRAYNEMRKSMLAWVGEHEDQPIAAPIVVAQLTRLQQFACGYGKIESVEKRKRQPDGTWKMVKSSALRLTEPSSKLDAVMQLIEDNPREQIVVFGQSKQVINMLAARLAAKDIPTGVLTGDTPQKDRGPLREAFQLGKLRIFVGTIKAGGLGITLTAASTVVFLDRAWSPSVNRQAEDRLHRIGQENAVQVIDIVARGTVDLGRAQRIQRKWSWIREILGDDPTDIQKEFLDRTASLLEPVPEVVEP